jgi:DNA-binding response OmpR family regulator
MSTVKPGCRVVLVEDDSTVAEGIMTLLEMDGFVVALAVNGADALTIIPQTNPDIVVMDFGLPDIGGMELFRRIDAEWPRLPVIFSSGQSSVPAIEALVKSGRAVALVKPYTIDALIAAIDGLLRRGV